MAEGEGEQGMILLIIAIVMSILFLTVEIPAFIRYHNEEDSLLAIMSGMMLEACIVVLFLWKGV